MNNLLITTQNWESWHDELIALVNGEWPSRSFRLLVEIFPTWIFRKVAKQLCSRESSSTAEMQTGSFELAPADQTSANEITLTLPAASIDHAAIRALKIWADQYLADDLTALVLHGSLGTDEYVFYSDFDGLVIIKDEVFLDSRRLALTAKRLFQARKFMYQLDPLQHHGWFVLPECALKNWPQHYLPWEVLQHASQLTQSWPQDFTLTPFTNSTKNQASFMGLMNAIKSNIRASETYANLYNYKGFISKILLLPTFYVQLRDEEGVFKRDSFSKAKSDFHYAHWRAIEQASAIRKNWPSVSPFFPRFLSQRPGFVGNIIRKRLSPAIPSKLKKTYDREVRAALSKLIDDMIDKHHSIKGT